MILFLSCLESTFCFSAFFFVNLVSISQRNIAKQISSTAFVLKNTNMTVSCTVPKINSNTKKPKRMKARIPLIIERLQCSRSSLSLNKLNVTSMIFVLPLFFVGPFSPVYHCKPKVKGHRRRDWCWCASQRWAVGRRGKLHLIQAVQGSTSRWCDGCCRWCRVCGVWGCTFLSRSSKWRVGDLILSAWGFDYIIALWELIVNSNFR